MGIVFEFGENSILAHGHKALNVVEADVAGVDEIPLVSLLDIVE